MPQRKANTFTGERITVSTSTPYVKVYERLYASIASQGAITTQKLQDAAVSDREAFTSMFEAHTGPHGFVLFNEYDHGSWIRLFGIGTGLRLKRVILGNALIAKTMIVNDLDAGLFVPVELLLRELEGNKGTEVTFVLPSSLIAGVNKDEKLVSAAVELDRKFEALVSDITA